MNRFCVYSHDNHLWVVKVYLINKNKNNRATTPNAQRINGRTPSDKEKVTKQQVRSMITSIQPPRELKYVNTSFSAYIPTFDGTSISALTSPTQGTSRLNRVGDIIRPKRIEIRGRLSGSVTRVCRMILFLWKPSSTPTGASVVSSLDFSTSRAPFAPYNQELQDNYVILIDQMHQISATGNQQFLFDHEIKMKHPVKYDPGTSVGTFKPYLLWLSDLSPSAVTYDLTVRMFFMDD